MNAAMDHTGFTGTREGLTLRQDDALRILFSLLRGWFHHGQCKGADEHAHKLAKGCGLLVETHPPLNTYLRAWLLDADKTREPEEYIARNHTIVDATDRLIAAPASETEETQGSGTWATVRYARKLGRPIYLVFPDGTIRMEVSKPRAWTVTAEGSAL